MAKQVLPAFTPGTRTLPHTKAMHGSRGKERLQQHSCAKAAAGDKSAKSKATEVKEIPADNTTKEDDPREIVTKPLKKRVLFLLLVERGGIK